jgi:hypothetical protein
VDGLLDFCLMMPSRVLVVSSLAVALVDAYDRFYRSCVHIVLFLFNLTKYEAEMMETTNSHFP